MVMMVLMLVLCEDGMFGDIMFGVDGMCRDGMMVMVYDGVVCAPLPFSRHFRAWCVRGGSR